MRLLVLGATGRTGRRVVEQAIAEGHDVAALVRRPGSAPEGTTEIVGDVTDPGTMKEAAQDCEAILIALAGNPERGYEILADAARTAVDALEATGSTRVVMVGSVGILDSEASGYRGDRFADEFKPIFEGHLAAFEVFRSSDCDWTLVCPPNLPDGPPSGDFEFAIEELPKGIGNQAFTGDVAQLMTRVLDDRSTFGKRLGVVSRQAG